MDVRQAIGFFSQPGLLVNFDRSIDHLANMGNTDYKELVKYDRHRKIGYRLGKRTARSIYQYTYICRFTLRELQLRNPCLACTLQLPSPHWRAHKLLYQA